jgi:magnesium-transporting ATPase (P-type)
VLDDHAWGRIGLNGAAIGLATFTAFLFASGQHRPEHEVFAVTLTTIALCEWVVAFTSRSQHRSTFSRLTRNRLLLPVMAVVVAMQLAIVYEPVLAESFHITRLSIGDWLIAIAAALFVVLVEEVRKAFSRRLRRVRAEVAA